MAVGISPKPNIIQCKCPERGLERLRKVEGREAGIKEVWIAQVGVSSRATKYNVALIFENQIRDD